MNIDFILASSSPRRYELLNNVGFNFEVIKPDIVEEIKTYESPYSYVNRIAEEKVLNVAKRTEQDVLIIAADTIVVVDDLVLGKPDSASQAYEMLNLLSGRTHEVITSFAIAKPPDDILHVESCVTEVDIKNLAQHEIHGYIKTNEPMDKAGSYAIQGIGSFMVKGIRGSYTNVVGLPLCELINALNKLGLDKIFS